MKAPVRLEDLEEFELVSRIPRHAIEESVLRGVRQLSEREHIEPFLREILPDKTETPHTSTEIADILTTHVTRFGQPSLAAFVNKGKSRPKVTAKDLTHQVLRLRQIPSLSLIVLLAVGDIQDDAKRDFLQIAEDANADYVIVDAIDVARLFIAYHKICPKDGTPYLDGRCGKCGTPASVPIEVTLKVYEEPRFTIVSLEDASWGLAKRYGAKVLTDSHYPKAVLREVIKKATWDIRQSKFYRSRLVESHFGEQEADCVFLFVYLDLRDLQQYNWLCRTSWIRPGLPAIARPLGLNGDEWLGEIEIGWNKSYEEMRDFFSKRLGKKEDWVWKVEALFPRAGELVERAKRLLTAHREGQLGQSELQTTLGQLEDKAMNVAQEAGNLVWPPLDCAECDSAFQAMVGTMHNVFVPFATWGRANWSWEQRIRLMEDALRRYEEDRDRFRYEWKKIRAG